MLLIREEGSSTKQPLYERVSKFHKHTSATWPGLDNLADYISEDSEGNIHLTSLDEEVAEIVLSANGLQLTMSFLCMLPFKKPAWV